MMVTFFQKLVQEVHLTDVKTSWSYNEKLKHQKMFLQLTQTLGGVFTF